MEDSAEVDPFGPLCLSYSGMKDTAKCIEVDLRMNRVYVACAAAGVFVWKFFSRQPLALLEHKEWVNSVRCFPPSSNSLTQSESDEMFSVENSTSPCPSPPDSSSFPLQSSPKYVLTASEDGIITAWCPHTFLIKERVRPGSGALTALHLAPVENDDKHFATADGFLCYAASLRHVYVLRVTPVFQLLHDLVHEGKVLCLTHFDGSFSCTLLCGQDNGCITVWHLSSGKYLTTIHYPSDAEDIEKDSKCADIHRPVLDGEENLVTETFNFNCCRSRAFRDGKQFMQSEREEEKYVQTISSSLDPFYLDRAVGECTSTNYLCKRRNTESSACTDSRNSREASSRSTSESDWLEDSFSSIVSDKYMHKVSCRRRKSTSLHENHVASQVEIHESSTFDLRRVTCLTTTPTDAKQSNRFYSGHGTGEVLIWESSFPNQPFLLLKKVQVFEFGSWVWNMQGLEVAKDEEGFGEPFVAFPKSVILQLCVWADSGAVRYIQAVDRVIVTEGPGFLSTCSYFIRTSKLKIRGEKEKVRTIDLRRSLSETLSSSIARQKPASYYVVMGSFQGRVEIFDISQLVAKLRREGIRDSMV